MIVLAFLIALLIGMLFDFEKKDNFLLFWALIYIALQIGNTP